MKIKASLRKISINRKGYDPTGRYWGIGAPLYVSDIELDGHYEKTIHLRAASRTEAQGKLDAELRRLGFVKDA